MAATPASGVETAAWEGAEPSKKEGVITGAALCSTLTDTFHGTDILP